MAILLPKPTRRATIPETIAENATLLNALADPVRLHILILLKEHPGTIHVARIVEAIGLLQPTISHHIRILMRARLLTCQKKGLYAYYRLNDETLKRVSAVIDGLLGKE